MDILKIEFSCMGIADKELNVCKLTRRNREWVFHWSETPYCSGIAHAAHTNRWSSHREKPNGERSASQYLLWCSFYTVAQYTQWLCIMTVYFKQTAFSSFYGKSYTLKAGSDK